MKNMRLKNIRSKKQYLFNIYIYIVLVISLLICAIIILNHHNNTMLKEQIVNYNTNSFEMICLMLDTTIEEMKEVCIDVASRGELGEYVINAGRNSDYKVSYERYQLYKMLGGYVKEKYYDVFVYFSQDDYIVSGTYGPLSIKNYCDAYYKNTAEFRDEFRANLEMSSKVLAWNVLNPDGKTVYFCISVKYQVNNENKPYVVCVVLRDEYFRSILGRDSMLGDGNVLLFDQNKELIWCDNEEKFPFHINGYTSDNALYEADFEGRTYMMNIYESNALKGYYVLAMQKNSFWTQLVSVRIFSIISIVVVSFVSLFFAYLASRKIYEPLKNVVKKLQKENYSAIDEEINEFKFIEQVLDASYEKVRELIGESERVKKDERELFLIHLLEGKNYDEDKEDIFECKGVKLCSDSFVVGLIQVSEKNIGADVNNIICNVFEEIFNRDDSGYLVSLSDEKCVFVLNIKNGKSKEDLKYLLKEGKGVLERYYDINLTIGCSRILEGKEGIREAYVEAQEALRYQYILGKERLISYYDIKGREFAYLNTDLASLYVVIVNYLEQNANDKLISRFVSELFCEYGIDENISIETLECFRIDILNAISRIGVQYGNSGEQRQKNIQDIYAAETLQELEGCMTKILNEFQQKKQEQKDGAGICEQTRKYLEENFAETQLGLPAIGEAMGMSVSYLSKLYKDKYGVPIGYDIIRIRLKNAKNMLKNTDKSISDIAEESGFSNSNVFIKTFKKWEGITPGKYRELL